MTTAFRIAFKINYVPEDKIKPRELEFDMTYQLLISVDNVNLFGDYVNTIRKNRGAFSDAC